MEQALEYYRQNSDMIHKIGMGVLILIALIIIILFIRKHKIATMLIVLISSFGIGFYFLNLSFGLHFSNELSAASIRSNLIPDKYEIVDDGEYQIYMQKPKYNDIYTTNGDFFAVKKMAFFYLEASITTKTYTIYLNDKDYYLNVKTLKVSDEKYYYAFYLNYFYESSINGLTTVTEFFLESVQIGDVECKINNLYFTTSSIELTDFNLTVLGQNLKIKE